MASILIDLTEDLEQQVVSQYEDLTGQLSGAMNSMAKKWEELCQKTKYDAMVRKINEFKKVFYEDVQQSSRSVFEKWKEGDASFEAMTRRHGGGEAAEATAAGLDTKIEDLFNGFWNGKPLEEEIQIDVSRPVLEDEDFETFEKICRESFTKIKDDIAESKVRKIKEMANDDLVYEILVNPVEALTAPIARGIEQIAGLISKFRDEVNAASNEQRNKNEEARQSATSSVSVADFAATVSGFLEDF